MTRLILAVSGAMLCMAASTQAAPVYIADLGSLDVLSPGVSLAGWGEAEPSAAHNPGVWYGGASLESARMVWGNEASLDTTSSASVTFPTAIHTLHIMFLDGIADDSFTVTVDGNPWGTYTANPSQSEYWVITGFSGIPGKVLEIQSLSQGWSGHDEFGTLAVDRMFGYAVPAPGALLLGAMGSALVGWLNRRRAL